MRLNGCLALGYHIHVPRAKDTDSWTDGEAEDVDQGVGYAGRIGRPLVPLAQSTHLL